jgi:broad specificity phosphatase PhoE
VIPRVFLVRHGAVDYGLLTRFEPTYRGPRHDFAPLTSEGVAQVERLIPVLRQRGCRLVISSPYTRTLQTAATLAAGLNCRLKVDLALHDWLPVRDGREPVCEDTLAEKIAEYDAWKATRRLPDERTWETDDEICRRVRSVLDHLHGEQVVTIVTHEAVIKAVCGIDAVPVASLREWEVA